MKLRHTVLPALLAAILSAAAFAEEAVPAITKPSQDVTLSFSRPGRVMEVPVKEGEAVKKGELVARQDDTEELAAKAYDEFKARDTTDIEKQQAILEQKKIDLAQKEKSGSAVTKFELDNSRLEVTVANANVKLAQVEHEQNGRKLDISKATVEKLRLLSPVTGVVEQTMVKAGEGVDQQTKVMRIVNIDPLWVEAPVKLAQARTAAKGDPAKVTFSDGTTRTGNIIFIANVADAASDTLLIRVEVPNPSKLPAGERVTVTFDEKKKAQATVAPGSAGGPLTAANAVESSAPESPMKNER